MKTKTIKNILVPMDFSKMSIQAIEVAKCFGEQFGATTHLAHVYQFYYPVTVTAPMPPVMPFSIANYDKDIEKKLRERLCQLAHERGLLSDACHICAGAPAYDELCNLAKEIPADLIVMPTHGHTGLKHLFLGSTAERVVQHAPCPVLVVRGEKTSSNKDPYIKNILVPVDFSGCSFDGLRYAIQFASKFGAKIVVQHVVDFGPSYTADGYAMYDLSKYREMARTNAEEQLREFVGLTKFGDVEFETIVTTGSGVWEICGLAENRKIDLIITSTHGRTGFKHVLIGSTAEQVVRHAPCSVLVVPSHPKVRNARIARRSVRDGKQRRRVGRKRAPGSVVQNENLTNKYRKRFNHALPERRATNKFRELHLRP